ncbi:MAG: hypothetical protein LBE18_08375 [Planctomycetaceae bacterium]|jgi:hypothetical protein|nr:hypothetical protein [Planctomycetaceae bacterium]
MQIKIFVQSLIIFLIFFVTINHSRCEIHSEIHSEIQLSAELLQGLANRGLFESAEILYTNESKKTNLNLKDKYTLTASIVYSRTLQIITATGSIRSKLYKQLTALESEFQNNIEKLQIDTKSTNSLSAESLELIRLQLQFAIAKYLIANRIQIESEIESNKSTASHENLTQNNFQTNTESQQMLLDTIEQLKKINTFLIAQQKTEIEFVEQTNSLIDNTNLYLYLAEISYTKTFTPNKNRYDKLNQIAVSLDEWSKKKLELYSSKSNLSESKRPKELQNNYYRILRIRVELAACRRLMNELDKSLKVINAPELNLNNTNLPANLQLRIAAEQLRFLIAISNNVTINNHNATESSNRIAEKNTEKIAEKNGWNIGGLLSLKIPVSLDSLDYCHARLEWGLFLADRMNITDSSTELMITADLLKLARQQELYVPSSSNIAAVTIGSDRNSNINSPINSPINSQRNSSNVKLNTIRITVLSELARYKNELNQIEEAAKLYKLIGQIAENSGDSETAIKNVQYSVSLLYNSIKQLELSKQKTTQNPKREQELDDEIYHYRKQIVEMLCDSAKRLNTEQNAIDLYRCGIDEATILFRAKRLQLDEYISILREYLSRWDNTSDNAAYRLRAAKLLELNGQFGEALIFLDKIPNDSTQAAEAIETADRCFKQIRNKKEIKIKTGNVKENSENINDNISDNISENINVTKNELDWFKRRLKMENSEWSEADAVTAIKIAERLFYRYRTPIFYWENVDNILSNEIAAILVTAISKCKTVKSVTSARLKIMLIIANNLRGDHAQSSALLKQISAAQTGLLTSEEQLFLRRFEAEILAMSGDISGAVKKLNIMLSAEQRNFMLLELKAGILSQQDNKELLTEAIKTWGLIATITKEKSEQWWNAREQIITIFIKQGNHEEAKKTYMRLKFLYPDLGNESRKNRLQKLIENL